MSSSVKKWARELATRAAAGEETPPHLVSAFAQHYVELVSHMDRDTEAAALFMEARATAHETSQRWSDPQAAIALRVAAHDIRQGLHRSAETPSRRVHLQTTTGLLVEMLGSTLVMDEETEGWEQAIAYRELSSPMSLRVVLLQRWDDDFIPVEDPDA